MTVGFVAVKNSSPAEVDNVLLIQSGVSDVGSRSRWIHIVTGLTLRCVGMFTHGLFLSSGDVRTGGAVSQYPSSPFV